jgi:hypothetical protein
VLLATETVEDRHVDQVPSHQETEDSSDKGLSSM